MAQVGPFEIDAKALQHEASLGVLPPKQNADRAGHQREQQHETDPGQQARVDCRFAKMPDHFAVSEYSR